jgi:uncharacterized SAM-dependent methyltransferase
MRLVSEVDQSIRIGDAEVLLSAGEYILTEHSHKYDLQQFADMAGAAGFRLTRQWSDENDWFSVCFLEVEDEPL